MDELRRIIREEVKRILQEGELEFIKGGKHTWYLKNDGLHISAANPHIRLEGTETGGADKGIREDAGTLKIYDFSAASDVMDLEAHASRHLSGGADEVLNRLFSAALNHVCHLPYRRPLRYPRSDSRSHHILSSALRQARSSSSLTLRI